jgi:hypothetical protein
MAADISGLIRLQQIVDVFVQARAELNRASLARMSAGLDNPEKRSAAFSTHARLCERVESLKREVVDVAAGRAR